MNNGYILWMTGVDTLFKNWYAENRFGISDAEELDVTLVLYEFYKHLYSHIVNHIGQLGDRIIESYFEDENMYLKTKKNKYAVIMSAHYSPERMESDISCNGITNVIFVRPQRQWARHKYVMVASGYGLSFFKQQIPEPVYNTVHSFITIDRSVHIHVNGDGNKVSMPIERKDMSRGKENAMQHKPFIEYIGDLIVQILAGAVNECGFFKALIGWWN